MTIEPLSRTSALADSGACSKPDVSSVSSIGMFCRSIGGAGAVALISNFIGCSPARALPVILIFRSPPISASALMPSMRFSTRSRRLENTTAPSVNRHAIDDGRIGVCLAWGGSLPRRWNDRARTLAQQRDVQHRAGDREFGDLRVARPQARKRHVSLDAADGQAVGAVAVLGVLQRDVVQRHIELRPHPDLGRACDRQPISGFALDPGLDRRGQEAGRHPDDQQQCGDDDDGSDSGACDFQCSHDDIPDRAGGPYRGGAVSAELIPERGNGSKPAKIIRRCCKVM